MSIHDDVHDVAVVGAGAAGLAASIFAAEATTRDGHARRIVLLDGAKTIGAKILVSGGGRCNVPHEVVSPIDFCGKRRIIKTVLALKNRWIRVWCENKSKEHNLDWVIKTAETGVIQTLGFLDNGQEERNKWALWNVLGCSTLFLSFELPDFSTTSK